MNGIRNPKKTEGIPTWTLSPLFLQGFPFDPRLNSEQKSRVFVVSNLAESDAAANRILRAANDQAIVSFDTEDHGLNSGRKGISYILLGTARAEAFIYCLPRFSNARKALGDKMLMAEGYTRILSTKRTTITTTTYTPVKVS